MAASSCAWQNHVLPSKAEAGSGIPNNADPSDDGVRAKRRKASAQATAHRFGHAAGTTPQGNSRALAPTGGRPADESTLAERPLQSRTQTFSEPPRQGSNSRYSPSTPKQQGTAPGDARDVSQTNAEANLAGGKREAQKAGTKMARKQALARLERKLRLREPRASTASSAPTQTKPSGSGKQSASHDAVPPVHSGRRRASSEKRKVVCTNNKFDIRLQGNGGAQRLGSRSACFRQCPLVSGLSCFRLGKVAPTVCRRKKLCTNAYGTATQPKICLPTINCAHCRKRSREASVRDKQSLRGSSSKKSTDALTRRIGTRGGLLGRVAGAGPRA